MRPNEAQEMNNLLTDYPLLPAKLEFGSNSSNTLSIECDLNHMHQPREEIWTEPRNESLVYDYIVIIF